MSNAKIDFAEGQEERGREAIADVRSDKSETDWVLFTYESPKSQKVKLAGKGIGGVSALKELLAEDSVGYGLVRKTDQVDDSVTVKFAFINFVGEKVPIMQKARISIHKSPMKDFIGQHHVEHTTSSFDELTDEIILEKVQVNSGTASRVLNASGSKQGVTSSQARATASGPASTPKKSGDLTIDTDAIKEAIALIRSDPPGATWVLAGYDGPNSNHVVKLASGQGDVAELVPLLKDDIVGYALVRKIEQFEMSETVKFAFIRFVGDNINRMLRARLGTHLGTIQAFFSPYHVALEATTADEVSDEIVARLISNASGTANKVLDGVAALNVRQNPSGPTTVRTSGAPGASTPASQTAAKPKPNYGGAPAPNVPKSLSSGQSLKFSDESELRNAIADVRSDATDTDWVLWGYEGGKGNTITVLGSGTGGVAALVSHLKDDMVGYGLVRKVDRVDDSLTVKFCFINFQGENIDRMHRARLGTHKGEVEALAAPYHVDILASQLSELSDEIVLTKIQETSGTKSRVKA